MKNTKIYLIGILLLLAVLLSGCTKPNVCGNGICEIGETNENCPAEKGRDCPPTNICGNNECDLEQGENTENCPEDCIVVEEEPIGAPLGKPSTTPWEEPPPTYPGQAPLSTSSNINLPSLVEEPVPFWCNGADTDQSGKVNANDRAILANNFGSIDCKEPDWCNGADITQDGKVDATDLANLAAHFGRTDCADPIGPIEAESVELTFSVSQEGKVSLLDIVAVPYAPEIALDSTLQGKKGDFSIKLSSSSEVVGYHAFKPNFTIMSDPPMTLETTVYSVLLPYKGVNTTSISEYIEDASLGEELLLIYASLLCLPNGKCEGYENYFSCPDDCRDPYAEDGICNSTYNDGECDWDCYWHDAYQDEKEKGECFP